MAKKKADNNPVLLVVLGGNTLIKKGADRYGRRAVRASQGADGSDRPAFSRQKALSLPYPTVKTAKGYRRVVVSPAPVTIVEKREIKKRQEQHLSDWLN